MNITGNTKFIPIIGNPTSHVFSPPAVNQWLSDNKIDALMLGLDIAPDGAVGFFDSLPYWNNLIGCSITFPYKQLAFEKIDDATESSKRLGVVNSIKREINGKLIGEMTDGQAMIRAIKKTGFRLNNKKAMIVGAGGGSGIAIVEALCIAGISHLILKDINNNRLLASYKLVKDYFPNVKIIDDDNFITDIYINATCLGINENDALPFDISLITNDGIYCDVVTNISNSKFIKLAIDKNAIVITGTDMGQAQIELQMAHFGLSN